MRGWLLALAVALPWLAWPAAPWLAWPAAPAAGQTLPPAVDPGILEQRLLPPRLPQVWTVVPRGLDCDSDPGGAATRFTLRGVILESEVRVVGQGDTAAHWRPHLGQEVSLDRVCAIARAVADDFARRSGQVLRAEIPAQRIAEGMVHIRIAEPGAAAPSPD